MPRLGPGPTARATILALAVGASPGGRAAVAAAADDGPDLAGRWTLNTERSEDARKKLEDSREDDRGKSGIGGLGPIGPGPQGSGPMGGGPMGRRPAGVPRGGRSRGPDEGTRTGGLMEEFLDPPQTLVIAQEAGEVSFDIGEESLLRLRPGGRKVKREGGTVELKARWKGDELVVDTEHEDGSHLTTSYRTATDRQTLYVVATVETPDGDEHTVRRIYEPAH
jgi:hypothetical protein